MQDVAQRVARHRPDHDMGVIGHDDPRAQLVTLAVEETNCASDEVRMFRITEVTSALAGIEVFVHAAGIPAEQFLLLVPGERAFCSHRLLKDGVTLLFKPEQDFLRKRAGLAERDEISAAFLFEMRERAAEMEAVNQLIGFFEWRGRSGRAIGRRLAARFLCR